MQHNHNPLSSASDTSVDTVQTVTATLDEPIRIDRYLAALYDTHSRTYFQNRIKDGHVLKNGSTVQKSSILIEDGDLITVTIPKAQALAILPEPIPLSILYEDADVLIVDKPKQMVVHPSNGHLSGTLVNAVLYHCANQLSGINGAIRPGIVHRIDQDTTGSLIICKNDKSHQCIAEQIRKHTVLRRYRGIVHGVIGEDSGTVNAPIGRDAKNRKKMAVTDKNAKNAVTHFKVLERFDKYTYIEFELETGRTHQIRVHMAHIRHPLLGDTVYGPAKCPFQNLTGQTLHAMTIGFIHPDSGKWMQFDAPLPDYFEQLLTALRK